MVIADWKNHRFINLVILSELDVLWILIIIPLLVVAGGVIVMWRWLRERGMDQWVPSYVLAPREMSAVNFDDSPVDVFISICDHYEPEWGNPLVETALSRVQRWHDDYPRLFGGFADVDGRPPRHTFFYPQDQYRPEYIDVLAKLCEQGFGEVDIHLHHHNDTAAGLEEKLDSFRQVLYHRHGVFASRSDHE